jgi:hypothetical protein
MSDSDTSIHQKVADLAKALSAVRWRIGVGGGLYGPFLSWFRASGPDAKPRDRDSRDRLKSCVKAAREFVKEVDTANRTLNALPDSVLNRLSALIGDVPWDVRTRLTLRAIQYEASFLKSISMDPSMLDSLLSSMGKDGFMQQQSKLLEFRLELSKRLMELDSLPPDSTDSTDAEHAQVEQSNRSKGLPEAALKAVIDGGLAGVLAAASKVDAVMKHSETMMAMLKTDNKYYAWTADDWVTHLEAAKRTILATDAWGHIKARRLENKAKRKAN